MSSKTCQNSTKLSQLSARSLMENTDWYCLRNTKKKTCLKSLNMRRSLSFKSRPYKTSEIFLTPLHSSSRLSTVVTKSLTPSYKTVTSFIDDHLRLTLKSYAFSRCLQSLCLHVEYDSRILNFKMKTLFFWRVLLENVNKYYIKIFRLSRIILEC